MRVLFLSKLFYPSKRIGAVRPSNFAKHLAEFGMDVVVITHSENSTDDFQMKGVQIIRVGNSRLISKIIQWNQSRVTNILSVSSPELNKPPIKLGYLSCVKNGLKKIVGEVFEIVIEYDWYYKARKEILTAKIGNTFDLAISSFGPLSSYLLGRYSSRKKFSKKWICDLRDNMPSPVYSSFTNGLMNRMERSAVREADAVVFVSEGQRAMFLKKYNIIQLEQEKYQVIYNGFEGQFAGEPKHVNSDKMLNLVYTGQLYKGKSNFEMLFSSLEEMLTSGELDSKKVRLSYAGQNGNEFSKQVAPFPEVQKIAVNLGYVSKADSIALQKMSDLLIVLSWNTSEQQGILTGKFLEYLKQGKPIISITSGNLPHGELTGLVKELNLGLACEYITYTGDKKALKEYLLKQYQNKMSGHSVEYRGNNVELENFSYEKISFKLISLAKSLMLTSQGTD